MPKDSKTKKKTLASSLCDKVNLKIPSSWEELSQDELRRVIELIYLYSNEPKGMYTVKVWVVCITCNFEVVRKVDAGWLCQFIGGKAFIIPHEMIPDILDAVSWIDHPEDMTDRIEKVGEYAATDFLLRSLPFGEYLQVENFYQDYLASKDAAYLEKMARLLYHVPGGEVFIFANYLPLSVFLWYSAVKKRFGQQFSHFLKPVSEGQTTGGYTSQFELVTAQIRLLTRGDVTKNKQIMDTPTWDALCELDALAKESEEIKKKNG